VSRDEAGFMLMFAGFLSGIVFSIAVYVIAVYVIAGVI